MSTTTDDDEIITDHSLSEYNRRYNAWMDSLNQRHRETLEIQAEFGAGHALRGRHGSLYSIKDEEYCSCLFGADCGNTGFPVARFDVDGPYLDYATAWQGDYDWD